MSSQPSTTESNYQVRALERGLQLLTVLADELPLASLQDLHAQTGLNKATMLRLLDVLQRAEFIEQDADSGAYRLGIKAFEVGMAFLPTIPIEQIAQPYLRDLMKATDLTTNLGLLVGHEVVHVAMMAPDRSLRFQIRAGYRDALHWTGLGKVLAAGMSEDELNEFLATAPFPRRTPNTITDGETFRQEVERVRQSGLASDIEEGSVGLACLAAPVRNQRGEIIAAVSISGLSHEVNDETRPKLEQQLLSAAKAISHRYGFQLGQSQND
jgi:IclR family acetate operon transcriptional repressor